MIPFFPGGPPSGSTGAPSDVSGCASLALHRVAMLCCGLTKRRPEIRCVRSHLGGPPGVCIGTQEAAT